LSFNVERPLSVLISTDQRNTLLLVTKRWSVEETMKGEGKDETFYSFAVGCSAQCLRGPTFTPLTCTASGTGATCTSDQQTRSALCTEPGPPASGMACNCTGSRQTIGGHLIPVNTCSSW